MSGFPASLEDRLEALSEAARAAAAQAEASESVLHAAGLRSASDIAGLVAGWPAAEREALENAWAELEQASGQPAGPVPGDEPATPVQRKRIRELI